MMKKMMTLLCAVLMGAALSVSADVGYWFDYPAEMTAANVDGCRFGLPVSSGTGLVDGAELSILLAGTRQINGLQLTLLGLNCASAVKGTQVAGLNIATRELDGAQVGVFNHSAKGGWQFGLINCCSDDATFQLGLVNYNENGWFPVTVLVNFGSDFWRDCGICQGGICPAE